MGWLACCVCEKPATMSVPLKRGYWFYCDQHDPLAWKNNKRLVQIFRQAFAEYEVD